MTPKFLPNDIIKDGDYYHRVHGMLGEVAMLSDGSRDIEAARIDDTVFAARPSDYANWTIVERDGKSYVPEKWKPEFNGKFFYPNFSDGSLYGIEFWTGDFFCQNLYERGLVFKTSDGAVAHARRMLEVK